MRVQALLLLATLISACAGSHQGVPAYLDDTQFGTTLVRIPANATSSYEQSPLPLPPGEDFAMPLGMFLVDPATGAPGVTVPCLQFATRIERADRPATYTIAISSGAFLFDTVLTTTGRTLDAATGSVAPAVRLRVLSDQAGRESIALLDTQGEQLWTSPWFAEVRRQAFIELGDTFLVNVRASSDYWDTSVAAINLANGSVRWQVPRLWNPAATPTGIIIAARPHGDNHFGPSHFVGIDGAAGTEVFAVSMRGTPFGFGQSGGLYYASATTFTSRADDAACVSVMVDPVRGTIRELAGLLQCAVHTQDATIVCIDGRVRRISETGSTVWESPIECGPNVEMLALPTGHLLVMSYNADCGAAPVLACISADDGSILWSCSTAREPDDGIWRKWRHARLELRGSFAYMASTTPVGSRLTVINTQDGNIMRDWLYEAR